MEHAPTIERLVRFIDDLSFDSQHFWVISDTKPTTSQWEICWQRNTQKASWSITSQTDNQTFQCQTPELVPKLREIEVDLMQFDKAVTESILTMACFADTFHTQAIDLLGDEAVTKSVERLKDFSNELINTIKSQLADPQPVLRVMPKVDN